MGYLTNKIDVLSWFDAKNTENVKNPFWVLYEGHDRRENVYKRDFNYEFSDPLKARTKLDEALNRRSISGGNYHLTVSDKAKDNVPSACENIILTAQGQGQQTGINGFNQNSSDTAELIRLHVDNAKLQLQLESAKNEQERARVNGIDSPVWRWFDGLSKHPNFDPNGPFNLINGLLGNIFLGSNTAVNPQVPPVNYGIQPPQVTAQAAEPQPTGEQKPVFTYKVAEIAKGYHNLCETLQLPPDSRNEFINELNTALIQMTPAERTMLINGLKQKAQPPIQPQQNV